MAPRTLVGGIAALALALGVLAGCTEGDDAAKSTAGDGSDVSASASAPPADGTGANDGEGEGDGAAGLQSTIEGLLAASPIKFEWESAELSEESKATLKKIAEAAAKEESAKLSIKTTAGNKDADKAKDLSQKRADAVKAELAANGVAEDRLEVEALGNEGVVGDKSAAVSVDISVVES